MGKIDFRIRFNREVPRCFRVTNHGDIVPHVPSVLTLWNHVGEEIAVRGSSPGAIPHSLVCYLDGLQHIDQPLDAVARAESVSVGAGVGVAPARVVMGMRTV